MAGTLKTSGLGHEARCRFAAASLAALAICMTAGCGKERPAAGKPLLCYVGGTMRPAMEELVRIFEQETGRMVDVDYGGSGENLIKVRTSKRGDLYVGHDPFMGQMLKEGLAADGWVVAAVTPTIVVKKGNPKGIQGLRDLARNDVRLGLTDAQYSTLGHVAPVIFDKAGLRGEIEANVVTYMRSGGQMANAVAVGDVDAAIVWNAVGHLRRDRLELIRIEQEYRPDSAVDAVTSATYGRIDMSQIGVFILTLSCSEQPAEAREFAEYVASPEGREVFARYGFSRARDEGVGAERGGSLRLYCGAGLRPAVAEAVETFRARTGCEVEADYAGSGMLLSRVKLAGDGDLFLPGDIWYVEEAERAGLVASKTMVSYLVPVILVEKGNPKRISGLADLQSPGIRLALGNPEACQIGRLCEEVFRKNGLDEDALKANVVFSGVTVNELGLQVKMGRADAAIVWDAVAAYYGDSADVVTIPAEENVLSHVAVGVLNAAQNRQLADEFVAFLVSEEGRAIFGKHHYLTSAPE